MPLPFTTRHLTQHHPTRPLPWLPWIASALFVAGLLAVLATVIAVATSREASGLEVRVVDADTAAALAGARVVIDGTPFVTDDNGRVTIPTSDGQVSMLVEYDGYVARTGEVSVGSGTAQWRVPLRIAAEQEAQEDTSPSELTGVLTEVVTQPEQPATDESGEATLAATPPASPTTTAVQPATELAGRIVDSAGQPIQGALLTDGTAVEITGADGVFSIDPQAFTGDTLRISASGYADTSLTLTQAGGEPVTVQMQLQPIKAIYLNPNISNTPEDIDRLINLINTTEINAIVIDVKEELIFYDTQVQFFRDVDTVSPVLDLPALLQRLQEHDIYTIARHVVFKDGLVAARRPDLAVMNCVTGDVWRDMNGVAWVNPAIHELWDANIELSVELAGMGFDEIQYDYVRFPTDGDLSTMDFGIEYNEANRVSAIQKFLQRSQEALRPTGAKQSADVFGFTVLVEDDLGIGQDIVELAPYVDYLSPMVYPSHFPDGAMGLDGHPNDYPYETIEISMSAGKAQLGSALKLRPWLQDFDFFDMIPYGEAEVRAQIDAAEAVGTSGWMLWDPNNVFTAEALGPDDGNMSRFESPSAVLPGTGTHRSLGRLLHRR